MAVVGGRFINFFGQYIAHGMGTLNSTLSSHLSVGVCEKSCFPDNYEGGKKLGP